MTQYQHTRIIEYLLADFQAGGYWCFRYDQQADSLHRPGKEVVVHAVVYAVKVDGYGS